MSFPRVNFWNSLTHLLSSASAWQGSIEWIFKIILNEITKFPFFQSIDSRNTIYRISFPYAFFYHSLVSSNSSFKTTGNRSFCRNAFHPSSIFVSFRLIDLSPRISVEESFPGEGNGGARGRKGFWIDERSTPFSLPVAFHPVVTRDIIQIHSKFAGFNGARSRKG